MDDLDRAIKDYVEGEPRLRLRSVLTRENLERKMHTVSIPYYRRDFNVHKFMSRYGVMNSFYNLDVYSEEKGVMSGWFVLTTGSGKQSESMFLCVNKGIVSLEELQAELFSTLL